MARIGKKSAKMNRVKGKRGTHTVPGVEDMKAGMASLREEVQGREDGEGAEDADRRVVRDGHKRKADDALLRAAQDDGDVGAEAKSVIRA